MSPVKITKIPHSNQRIESQLIVTTLTWQLRPFSNQTFKSFGYANWSVTILEDERISEEQTYLPFLLHMHLKLFSH